MMRKQLILFSLVVYIFQLQEFVESREVSRIVGGHISFGSFPSVVSVQAFNPLTIPILSITATNYSHICGGTILTASSILTAAHCVQSDVTTMSIYAGVNDWKHDSSGQRINVTSCNKHSLYSPAALNSVDLAVCFLQNPLTFNTKVAPVKLNQNFVGSGVSCQLMGWGASTWDPMLQSHVTAVYDLFAYPYNIRVVDLTTIANGDCATKFQKAQIKPGQICADAGMFFWKGGCTGDAGGPLVCNGQQVGVLSFGTSKCGVGQPSVFTRVSEYLTWIQGGGVNS